MPAAIPGYRFGERLRVDSAGTVVRAEQLTRGRDVELRIITADLSATPAFSTRLRSEVTRWGSFHHPNLPPVYEVGEIEGAIFVATRYTGGVSLEELLDETDLLESERVAGILSQAGAALDSAHGRGLIHGAVSPSTLRVVEGERDHVYVTDFAIVPAWTAASRFGSHPAEAGFQQASYLAPEQLRGDAIRPRADVYALGCVAFRALTGSAPFEADLSDEDRERRLTDPPPSARELNDAVSEKADEAIAKAMAVDPGERFPTAGEFATATSAALVVVEAVEDEEDEEDDAAEEEPEAAETEVLVEDEHESDVVEDDDVAADAEAPEPEPEEAEAEEPEVEVEPEPQGAEPEPEAEEPELEAPKQEAEPEPVEAEAEPEPEPEPEPVTARAKSARTVAPGKLKRVERKPREPVRSRISREPAEQPFRGMFDALREDPPGEASMDTVEERESTGPERLRSGLAETSPRRVERPRSAPAHTIPPRPARRESRRRDLTRLWPLAALLALAVVVGGFLLGSSGDDSEPAPARDDLQVELQPAAPPGSAAARFDADLRREVSALNDRLVRDRNRLREARTAGGQVRAARALARDYEVAESGVSRSAAPARLRSAKAAIVGSLQRAGRAYRDMSGAALRANRGAYARAVRSVERSEAALRAALTRPVSEG